MTGSRTYRLSSEEDVACAARDPGNRWYWRFDRRRLDAEEVRDALLTVGGNLDRNRPGPHPGSGTALGAVEIVGKAFTAPLRNRGAELPVIRHSLPPLWQINRWMSHAA